MTSPDQALGGFGVFPFEIDGVCLDLSVGRWWASTCVEVITISHLTALLPLKCIQFTIFRESSHGPKIGRCNTYSFFI